MDDFDHHHCECICVCVCERERVCARVQRSVFPKAPGEVLFLGGGAQGTEARLRSGAEFSLSPSAAEAAGGTARLAARRAH